MAYGAWHGAVWREVANNGYYAVDCQINYQQDPIANATRISVMGQRVRSLNGYYSFNYSATLVGIGDFTGTKYPESRNVSVGGGGTTVIDLTDRHTVIGHNSDGSWKAGTYCGWWRFIVPLGTHNVPYWDWTPLNVDNMIPKIDRTSGTASFILSSNYPTMLRMRYTPNVDTDAIQYRVDGGSWVAVTSATSGTQRYFDITGLSPNKSYKIECRHRRAYNQVWSGAYGVTASTTKPAAPTAGSISLASATINTIKLTVSEFAASAPASISYYQYTTNNGSSWATLSNSTISGLSPNTTYKIGVRAVDNYGTVSSTVYCSFTTPKPAAGTAGTLTVGEITPFTVALNWSGFSAGTGANISYYEWGWVRPGVSQSGWSRFGAGTSGVMSGLLEETAYQLGVRAVDNYGTPSKEAWVNVTTLVDQSKVRLNVLGNTKIGRVWINVNGTAKKSKKIWINVNGTAKLFKNA